LVANGINRTVLRHRGPISTGHGRVKDNRRKDRAMRRRIVENFLPDGSLLDQACISDLFRLS
jgi:hypothetical protein